MFQSLVKSPGWGRVGEILLTQTKLREGNLANALVRTPEEIGAFNKEQGIVIGIRSIPQFVKGYLQEVTSEYQALLMKEREE